MPVLERPDHGLGWRMPMEPRGVVVEAPARTKVADWVYRYRMSQVVPYPRRMVDSSQQKLVALQMMVALQMAVDLRTVVY